MKQKMKKCWCLMLSFVFVLSNCQVFAQVRPATSAVETVTKADVVIPEELLTKLEQDMKALKHSLENLEFYADLVLEQSQFAEIEPYVLERYKQYLKEVEELYTSVVNRSVAYKQYLAYPWVDGTGGAETIIKRAASQYTSEAPNLVVRNVAFEEGATIKAIEEEIGKVIGLGPEGVHYAANTAKVEENMNKALKFLSERLEYYDYMQVAKAQKELTMRIDDLITEGVITRERVLNYVVDHMSTTESRFLSVLKSAKAGKVKNIQLAKELSKYLIEIGSKQAKCSIYYLMKHVSYDAIVKNYLSPKTQKLIKDFPELLEEGSAVSATKMAEKGLKFGPVAVVAVLLTAALITEVKSDNHFGIETVSNRQLANLKRSIDNNTASFADKIMFYSHPQSDKLTNENPKYLIESLSLAMNLEEAAKNFDMIDNILSNEALAANYDVNEEFQNKLDEQLASITDKVAEDVGMI